MRQDAISRNPIDSDYYINIIDGILSELNRLFPDSRQKEKVDRYTMIGMYTEIRDLSEKAIAELLESQ